MTQLHERLQSQGYVVTFPPGTPLIECRHPELGAKVVIIITGSTAIIEYGYGKQCRFVMKPENVELARPEGMLKRISNHAQGIK